MTRSKKQQQRKKIAVVNSNANGGFYVRGRALSLEKKMEVALVWFENVGLSLRKVAKLTKVSLATVQRVVQEIKSGGVVDPKDKIRSRSGKLSINDKFFLLQLRHSQPNRVLGNYRQELMNQRGVTVSVPTICRFFCHEFRYRGSIATVGIEHASKYSAENIQRARDYAAFVSQIDPRRIKFGDEKHLKGSELINKKSRRCPITGTLKSVVVDSNEVNLQNTYTIVGFCGIVGQIPMEFFIHDDTNDASTFVWTVEQAILHGSLVEGDVLVLDNASIHRFQQAQVLEEWLWERFGIYLLYLPVRSPELNPIELLWHLLVQRMKKWRDFGFNQPPAITANVVAQAVLEIMTFEDVRKAYKKCGYIA